MMILLPHPSCPIVFIVSIPAPEQLKINLIPNKWQHFQDRQFVPDREVDYCKLDKRHPI